MAIRTYINLKRKLLPKDLGPTTVHAQLLTPTSKELAHKTEEPRAVLDTLLADNHPEPKKPKDSFTSYATAQLITGAMLHVRCLLKMQASGEVNEIGRTKLHMAAKRDDITTIEQLMAQGADYKQEDYFGRTAFQLASPEGQKVMIHHIADRSCSLSDDIISRFTALTGETDA